MNKRTEKDLYKPILIFLNAQPSTKAWLHHNNAIYLPKIRCFVRKAEQEDGIPDILGVKNGKAFAFEVKATGRIRKALKIEASTINPVKNVEPNQIIWMVRFVLCGGKAFVVDNLQDVIQLWNDI